MNSILKDFFAFKHPTLQQPGLVQMDLIMKREQNKDKTSNQTKSLHAQ